MKEIGPTCIFVEGRDDLSSDIHEIVNENWSRVLDELANRTSGKVVSEIIFRGIFVTTRNQAIYTNNLFQFFETGLFSFQKCLQFLIQITHITNK